MSRRMRLVFLLLFLTTGTVYSQKLKKDEKMILADLQASVRSLQKESAPGELIKAAFEGIHLKPYGDKGGWLESFERYEGRFVRAARVAINDVDLAIKEDYFPLSFSANRTVEGDPAVALQESGEPWFVDLKEYFEVENRAASSVKEWTRSKTRQCVEKGATAIIFFNSTKKSDSIVFDEHDTTAREQIPALYITGKGRKRYLTDEAMSMDMDIAIDLAERKRTVSNMLGFLDNGGLYTSVLCAHYTDTASYCALAGLLELARKLKETKDLRNNYLFITLTGERSDSIGLVYFLDHSPLPRGRIGTIISLDKLGRTTIADRITTVKRGVRITGFSGDDKGPTDYVAATRLVKTIYALAKELDGQNKQPVP